jgi:Ser/Thr protein kinase RdoA (MazF antagonist)
MEDDPVPKWRIADAAAFTAAVLAQAAATDLCLKLPAMGGYHSRHALAQRSLRLR